MSKTNQHIIGRDRHEVSRKDISDNALKVLYRLHNAGYQAFLVGGGVRDILLGLHPKDFDISTDATPEEIRKLFRNCRIIGRRFRLAHIIFGRDIIEVATFRAHCDDNIEQDKGGMILRDNVYGTVEEDALRRDFTVNALYYNIADFSVHDYCNGLEDLKKKQMRVIGDPEARYREDPVRMLRAVRLSSKLGLSIENKSQKPIKNLAKLLEQIPAARLWEEYKKMFLSGKGYTTYHQLNKKALLEPLFPQTQRAAKKDPEFQKLINIALKNTDKRIENELSINPAFLLAVMLWKPLLDKTEASLKKKSSYNEIYFKSMNAVINEQTNHVSIMRRYSLMIQDIWALQVRLKNNYNKRAFSVFEHPRFRAGYDFLLIRAELEPNLKPLADWWTEFQKLDPQGRRKLINQANNDPNRPKQKRKRNYRSKKTQPHKGGAPLPSPES